MTVTLHLLLLIVLSSTFTGIYAGEIDLDEILDTCNAEFPGNEELILYLMANGQIEDESNVEAKCFLVCLLRKMGFVDENSNLLLEQVKKHIEITGKDMSVVEKCIIPTENEDKCEEYYQDIKCVMKNTPWTQFGNLFTID